MEKYKEEIESKKLVHASWLPVLRFNGGRDLVLEWISEIREALCNYQAR